MRKVIGVGETILDIIFRNNKPQIALPGGTVFNGLVSLTRTGVPVSFVSELGDDEIGNIIRAFMKANRISVEHIDAYPDAQTPLAVIFLDGEQNASYSVYKNYPAQRLDVAFPQIEKDDIFIFGSYYALNPALRERMVELLEYAKEKEALIYYDPNFRKPHAHESLRLRPTVIENLEYADIVRTSVEDIHYLYGETETQQVYEEDIRFYCKYCIITQGEGDILLFADRLTEHFEIPALPKVISTVAAGDNFNAGLIYGLLKYDIRRKDLEKLRKEEWEKIIRCGVAFASEACQSYDNYVSETFAANYKL